MNAFGGVSWAGVAPSVSTSDIVSWMRSANARDRGVIGFGFGIGTQNGHRTGTLSSIVIVRRKLEDPECPLPATLFGHPTDVIARGPKMMEAVRPVDKQARVRRGGGRVDIDARPWGTLGCTVSMPGGDGRPVRAVLSNAHVLVPPRPLVPPAKPGPATAQDAPEPVTVYDDHALSRKRAAIAKLSRFVPLVPIERGFNVIDGACAEVTDDGVGDGVAGLGAVREALSPASLKLGMPICKTGAASKCAAHGEVRMLRAAYLLRTRDYGVSGTGDTFVFAEQVFAEVHQIGGDSGSVLLDRDRRAVGLVHARHPEGWAVAAPAWTVEASLGVRFGDPDR